jgi:hypothetical protein
MQGLAEQSASDLPGRESPSLRVGDARVIDTRVNPLASMSVTSERGEIAVSYGKQEHSRAIARLDGASLDRVSAREGASSADQIAAAGPARVTLDDGHIVLVWRRGSVEWGHRVVAQELGTDGTPYGAPVVLSSPEVDVMGAPQAVSMDGRRVVATFAVASAHGVDLVAVPLEPAQASESTERIARR